MKIRANILFISVLIGFAYPCSCLEPPPPEEAYEEADVVLSGKVINMDLDESGYYFEVSIQTIDVWKGDVLDEIIILTETSSDACGYEFQINNEYLIYAYNYNGGVYTNICTRTNLLEYASEDLDYLNQLSICDSGYTEYDGECYFDEDLNFLTLLIYMNEIEFELHYDIGLTIWQNGRINTLLLEGMKIHEIPNNIQNLDSLVHLSFSDNELEHLPDAIGNLPSLNALFISNNILVEIPSTIGNLGNLEFLHMPGNQLTELPLSISNISSLMSLNIDNNYFTTFPSSLLELNNLKYVYIANNAINNFPTNINMISSLQILSAYSNNISILPSSVGELSNLYHFDFANNDLTTIPETICNIYDNLTVFDIGLNEICPPYPYCIENVGYQDTSECEGCCYEEFLANENCDGGGCFIPQCTENCEWEPMQCWGSTGYCWCVDENGIEIEGTSQPSWEGFPDCGDECDLGDVNCDDSLNVLDIVLAANMVLADEYDEIADMNEDGQLNVLDIIQLVNWILDGVPPVTEWVTVPAGDYTYGINNAILNINYDYDISKYPVTNAQYVTYLESAVANGNIIVILGTVMGYYIGDEENASGDYVYLDLADEHCRIIHDGVSFSIVDGYENHPVVEVSWFGANAFAEYYQWRLPDEYEWEKAARGDTGYSYPFGNSMNGSQANYYDSGDPYEEAEWSDWPNTSPVGFYNGQNFEGFVTIDSPSPYGAYDMAGNVWEYTGSWYFNGSPLRVRRGGSWYVGLTSGWCRSWFRDGNYPTGTYYDIGFRVAQNVP